MLSLFDGDKEMLLITFFPTQPVKLLPITSNSGVYCHCILVMFMFDSPDWELLTHNYEVRCIQLVWNAETPGFFLSNS